MRVIKTLLMLVALVSTVQSLHGQTTVGKILCDKETFPSLPLQMSDKIAVCRPSGFDGIVTLSQLFNDINDYGDQTVTQNWDYDGQLGIPSGSGSPTATDCDAAGEADRIYYDSANDLLYCCPGASGWKACGDGGGTNPLTDYDADIPPGSGLIIASTDEFESGFDATWRWQNQGSATDVVSLGSASMTEPDTTFGNDLNVRCLDAGPTTADWVVAIKFSGFYNTTNDQSGAGLLIITGGTEASPTEMFELRYKAEGTNDINLQFNQRNDYTAGITTAFYSKYSGFDSYVDTPVYFLAFWDDSASTLYAYHSRTGSGWVLMGSDTTAGDPISVCRMINFQNGNVGLNARFHWFRTCTSSACISSPNFQIGE